MVYLEQSARLYARDIPDREVQIERLMDHAFSFKDQVCNIGIYDQYQHEFIAARR